MAGATSTRDALPLLLLISALALAGLAVWAEQSTPAPLGDDVGADTFSATRAAEHLRHLLGDERPHPVGSAANARVRERLIATLERLGLDVTVQRAVGCGFGTCGRVSNVLAAIPGDEPSALLLMAHYDSVPAAPGAGDDGAGVAALLEVARILEAGAPYRNSILFAFTDGEEPGLLGADAFFTQHPWTERIEAVINLEGSGSSGAVSLLRVGPGSGALVRAFREVSTFPVAASILQEVFEVMPNNTDFSLAMEASLPGIDFAFAGDRLHYHTPLDSIANLDRGTLQHHGDNVLPLARRLADADLGVRADNFVYVTVANRWWITWPVAASVPLALAVLVLLGAAAVLARRALTWRRLAGGAAGALAMVIAVVAVEIAAWAIADRLVGTRVAWPAHPWPWRLLTYGAAAAAALGAGSVLAPRLGFWGAQLGGWSVWALLALAAAVLAPLAANILLLPALFAALVTLVIVRGNVLVRYGGVALCVAFAGYWILATTYSGEVVTGFAGPAALYGPLALLAMPAMPLMAESRPVRAGAALSLLGVVVGIGAAPLVPLYSAERPQHLNIRYAADADANEALWLLQSPNALPPRIRALHDFAPRPAPWYSNRRLPSAPAPYVAAPPPELTVLADTTGGGERHLSLVLRSPRAAPVIMLALPESARVTAAAWEGHGFDPGKARRRFTFHDPPAGGVHLELTLDAGGGALDADLLDLRYALPDAGSNLVRARGALGTQMQQGDVWIVTRRVEL